MLLLQETKFFSLSYLHHEKERVEDNKQHDEVLERSGGDNSPHLELQRVSVLRHVPLQRSSSHGEIYARLLVLVNVPVLQLTFPLLLEGDDYQRHEDVHKEEGEHDKVDNVENGHFNPKVWHGAHVLPGSRHGVLQDPKENKWDPLRF